MPGHPLGLTLPQLSDPPDTQASLTITALAAIVADLEGTWTTSEVSADGPLNLSGQSLLNAAGASLVDFTFGTPAVGQLYRSGSSLFYVDSLGAVRITNGAALNLSVNGGFVGDLAHLNASYNYANNEYTFASNDPHLSVVTGAAVKVKNDVAGHYIKLQPDPALAADQTWTLFSRPASGISLLSLDGATGNVKQPDDEARRVTNDVHLSTVYGPIPVSTAVWKLDGATGLVTGLALATSEADVRHTNRNTPLIPTSFIGEAGWAIGLNPAAGVSWSITAPAGPKTLWIPLPLAEGEVVTDVTVNANWTNATYVGQFVYADNNGAFTGVGGGTINYVHSGGTSTVNQTFTPPTPPLTLASMNGRTYYFVLTCPTGATVVLYAATAQHTR